MSIRGHRRLRSLAPSGARVLTPPLPARLLRRAWLRWDAPSIDRVVGPQDVVYGPNFVVPPSRASRVMTVHDLTPLRFPELCDRDTLDYPGQIQRAASSGAWIHTSTRAIRDEVVSELGVPAQRVVVVPMAHTTQAGGDEDAGRRLAGRQAYVLAVGTIEPRKDLTTLVRSISALADSGTEVPLVHVGPDGWALHAFETAVAASGRPDLVTRLGMRSEAELRDLYAGARAVVYPSRYEGFGFPVLEAMSAGTPVITTRVPAIEEVAGEAAVLVDVGDDAGLADAIRRVWTDDALVGDRRQAGLRRVQAFDWDATANGLIELLRTATGDASGL